MRKLDVILILALIVSFETVGQEYDDMYFNSSDRKKAKKEQKKENSFFEEFQTPDGFQFRDTYEEDTPSEMISEDETQTDLQYQSPFNSTNTFSNYDQSEFNEEPLDFQYSQQEIYDQGYQDGYDDGSTLINNHYGNNVRPRWNGSLGINSFYDPWYGWGSGWGISIGWGWNSWGYDPWIDPYWNPWYGRISWYRPNYWGWGNPWNRYYCPSPYYDWGGNYIVANSPSKVRGRDKITGPRIGRGGNVVVDGGPNSGRGSAVINGPDRKFSRASNDQLSGRGTSIARTDEGYVRRGARSTSGVGRVNRSGADRSGETFRRRSTTIGTKEDRGNTGIVVRPRTDKNTSVNRGKAQSNNRKPRNYAPSNNKANRNSNVNRSNSSNNNKKRSYSSASSSSSGSRSSGVKSSSGSSRSSSSRSSGSRSSSSSRKRGN